MSMRSLSRVSLFALTLLASCAKPPPATPTTPTTQANKPTRSADDSAYESVIAVSGVDSSGRKIWNVSATCTSDEFLPADVKEVVAKAKTYLVEKQLLPPTHRFCATQLGADRWEIVCVPTGRYINTPITVLIAAGKVENHFYSAPVDPRAPRESSLPPERNLIPTTRPWIQTPGPAP